MQTNAALFSNKNMDYGDAYVIATDIMSLLVPDKSKIITRSQQIIYHNMYSIVTKLLRACNLLFNSTMHKVNTESVSDSLKDGGVYFNMIAEIYDSREKVDKEYAQ
jgi:hypothetical protein